MGINVKPMKFPTVKSLSDGIDGYFNECSDQGYPVTKVGMACYLKCHRDTLNAYEKGDYDDRGVDENGDTYSDVLKLAEQKIQATVWQQGMLGNINSAFGTLYLKTHHGATDKTDVTSGGQKVGVTGILETIDGNSANLPKEDT